MLTRRTLLNAFVSLGLLLGVSISSAASAQASESVKEQTSQFRRIEQPLPLKVSVTLGGIGLIGLEIWWFQFSKAKAQQARVRQGVQEIGVTVKGLEQATVTTERPQMSQDAQTNPSESVSDK